MQIEQVHRATLPGLWQVAGTVTAMRAVVVLVAAGAVLVGACSGAESTSTTAGPPDEAATTTLALTEDTVQGIVSAVVTGDTVEVTVGAEVETVRLTGIRAPQGTECYAAEASLALSDLVAGRSVALVGDGADGDGIALRYLVIEDEVPLLVNVEMVARGAAVALFGHELEGDFLRVNDAAYASGVGMWGTFACGHTGDSVSPDRPQLRIQQISVPATGSADPASIELVNASYTPVAIGGWTIRDGAATASFTFPAETVMAPGDTLTLELTCSQQATGLAWCVDGDLSAATGATFLLQDQLGNVVERKVLEPQPQEEP
jgi:endonuclease YncB( thermonuclease family)